MKTKMVMVPFAAEVHFFHDQVVPRYYRGNVKIIFALNIPM